MVAVEVAFAATVEVAMTSAGLFGDCGVVLLSLADGVDTEAGAGAGVVGAVLGALAWSGLGANWARKELIVATLGTPRLLVVSAIVVFKDKMMAVAAEMVLTMPTMVNKVFLSFTLLPTILEGIIYLLPEAGRKMSSLVPLQK